MKKIIDFIKTKLLERRFYKKELEDFETILPEDEE